MFEIYVKRILAQVEPDLWISIKAKRQLNDFVVVFTKQFASAIINLMDNRRSNTLMARDVQTAVRILLKGQLAKHAISEGTKAVTHFVSFDSKKAVKRTNTASKTKIIIPPVRIEKILREQLKNYAPDRRLAENASVYLAAVIEYLLAEILELSSHFALDNDKKIITPEMIHKAIKNDTELDKTFCGFEKQLFSKKRISCR